MPRLAMLSGASPALDVPDGVLLLDAFHSLRLRGVGSPVRVLPDLEQIRMEVPPSATLRVTSLPGTPMARRSIHQRHETEH